MPKVYARLVINGQTVRAKVGQASVVIVPNYPGSTAIPAGTINATFTYIGANYTKTADLPNFASYTTQINTNTTNISALTTIVSTLTSRVVTLEATPAPNGIASGSVNNANELVLVRSDGQQVNVGQLSSLDQTARNSAAAANTAATNAQTTANSASTAVAAVRQVPDTGTTGHVLTKTSGGYTFQVTNDATARTNAATAQSAADAANTNANTRAKVVTLTQAQYDALSTKDAGTIYAING